MMKQEDNGKQGPPIGPEVIRARLYDMEAKAEAENRAGHAPADRALNLERLWSWAGALRWALNEEAKG